MIAPTLPSLFIVYALLFIFGVAYNLFMTRLEERGYHEGYVSFLVAGGVLVTLIGIAVFDSRGALIALGAFTASGTPMIIGSMIRHMRERDIVARAKAESANAEASKALAK